MVLRLVNRGCLAYMELRDSIANRGVLNSILVRPSVRFPGKYDVADGLYRVNGARDAGLPMVPALVKDLTDDDLLAIQIQANAIRPETTPMEFARQIKRIMEAQPEVTMAEISRTGGRYHCLLQVWQDAGQGIGRSVGRRCRRCGEAWRMWACRLVWGPNTADNRPASECNGRSCPKPVQTPSTRRVPSSTIWALSPFRTTWPDWT